MFINLVTTRFCYDLLFVYISNISMKMLVVKTNLIVHIVQSNMREHYFHN
jgi:hypothetical protein